MRRIVRRRRTRALGLTGAGLAVLAAFVALAVHYSDDSAWLRAHGVQVPGLVVSVREDARGSEGAARVAYVAEGRRLAEVVDLGSDASSYEVGQSVRVYYEAPHPTHMTIDDEDNQPTSTVMPMILLLVGGAFALLGGIVWTTVVSRTRSLLANAPWQRVEVDVRTVPSGRTTVSEVTLPDGTRARLYSRWRAGEGRRTVDLVRGGRRVVLASTGAQELRAGKILRSGRRRP